jgi:8-oxo-dGTP diphosphatase
MAKLSPTLVTAALICERQAHQADDRVLIAKRKLDAKVEAGKWEFPGGKVEACEHPEACLVREIKEELNLDVKVEGLFDLVSHVYRLADGREVHVVLLFYLCELTGGDLQLLDVADAKWVTIKDFDNYDFAVADQPVIERLKTRGWAR